VAKRKQKPNACEVTFAIPGGKLDRFMEIAQLLRTGVLETQYLITVHVPFEKYTPLTQAVLFECNGKEIDISPKEARKKITNTPF